MNDDDDILWVVIGGIVLLVFAPGILGTLFTPVQSWLLAAHLLTNQGVLIPIGVGAGLDFIRILIVVGLLLISAALAVLVFRQRTRQANQR